MKKKTLFFAVNFFSIFLTFIPFMWAQDNAVQTEKKSKPLSQIKILISETRYDEALEELNLYINDNPKDFDEAQKLVKKCLDVRNQYSKLSDEIFHVILTDPENNEKIYRLTQQLKSLERSPSDQRKKFLVDLEIAAEFNYFKAQYGKIQAETVKLAGSSDYVKAAEKSRSGFYIYEQKFKEDYSGTPLFTEVKQEVSNIDQQIGLYRGLQNRLKAVKDAYIENLKKGDINQISKSYEDVIKTFGEFAEIRNKMVKSGKYFEDLQEKNKRKDTNITDANYFSFMFRSIFGQKGMEKSGIVGVMDSQFVTYVEEMKKQNVEMVHGAEKNVLASYKKGAFEKNLLVPDEKLLDNLYFYSNQAVAINSLYDSLKNLSGYQNVEKISDPDFNTNFLYSGNIVTYYKKVSENAAFAIKNNNSYKSLSRPQNPQSEETGKKTYSNGLWNLTSQTSDCISRQNFDFSQESWYRNYNQLVQTSKKSENWKKISDLYVTYENDVKKFSIQLNEKVWKDYAAYYDLCGAGFVQDFTKQIDYAQSCIDGVPDPVTGVLLKYPEKAVEIADSKSSFNVKLEEAKKILSDSLVRLDTKNKNLYQDSISGIKKSRTRLDDMNVRLTSINQKGRNLIVQANKAKNEAELRFSQAQKALNSEEFETARKRLQDALGKYTESLSYQHSDSLQKSSDEKIAELAKKIVQEENKIVVREVRDLKKRARQEYTAGNFERASALLNTAKARWATTNDTEDIEITNLFTLVERALKMNTGRELSPSDPLYQEMSQTLSIANQYYNTAVKYIEQNNKTESNRYLNLSLEKVNQIKIVYPLNKDAAVLLLKIQKFKNPDQFNKQMAQKVKDVKKNIKNTKTQQEAYTELLNLYELDKNYPGLKQLIYDVEIALGIRAKPVDRTNIIKSENLAKEAKSIYEKAGRNEILLNQALAKVNEALTLNPDNGDAITLKDRIQIASGGHSVVVLSSVDEVLYQQAVSKLNSGDAVGANAIVEQLLQKSNNKRSSKILDLQKQIRVRL